MEPVKLDAHQTTQWSHTKTALMWAAPAFTHIFYSMLDCRDAGNRYVAFFTRDVPIAATDGTRLLLNPDTFFGYNLHQRVFIVCHEILHCMFEHVPLGRSLSKSGHIGYSDGKRIPYNHDTMNIAMDFVINDLLIESKIGEFSQDWLHDTKAGTCKDAVTEVYRRIYKDPDPAKGKKAFDQLITSSGNNGAANGNQKSALEWKVAINAAKASAKAQGKLPAALERALDELLDPKVDWTGKIAGLLARRVGSGSSSWRSPDRRLIVRDMYAPGRTGHGADTIVVVGDTSGSMTDAEMQIVMGELRGIIEDIRPKRVLMMWCDAIVHSVEELESASDIHGLKPKGGGGTSFIPPFEWLADNRITPDGLIYITDGYGSFPESQPSYPVIWGDITGPGKIAYPWGDVVHIPRGQLT